MSHGTRPPHPTSASPAATALAAALALAALVYTPTRHLGEFTLPRQLLLQLTAGASLLWIALRADRRARARALFSEPATRWLALSGCAWLAWSGASLAWSPSACVGWPAWYGWLVSAGVALAVATLCTRHADRLRVAGGLVWGAAGVAALGMGQYLLGWEGIPQVSAPAASFGNRNFAAEVVVLALPFAGLRFVAARTPRGWIAAGVALVGMGAYLIYVRSTAAWIAALLAVACLLACCATPRIRRDAVRLDAPRLAGAALGGLMLLLLAGLAPRAPIPALPSATQELTQLGASVQQLQQEGAAGVRAASMQERLHALRNTLPMLRDHPLVGVGVGGWRVHFPRYASLDRSLPGTRVGRHPLHAQNDYLQLLAECGLVGGALLLGAALALARAVRHALARSAAGEEALLCCACLASLAALCVTASVGFPLQNVVPPAWAAAALGLLTGRALPDPRALARRAEPVGRRAVAVAASALLALAGVAWALDAWRYDLALSRVLALLESGLDREALRAAAPLLARDRDDAILLSRVGGVHLENDSAAGLPLFERIQAFDPWNATNLMSLARSHHYAGNTEQAIAHARRALEIAPSCDWCQRFLARRERELGPDAGPGSPGGAP